MKKLFLFLSVSVLAFSLNSCSSDSDSGGNSVGGKITFKIGSQSKNFNTVIVDEDIVNGGTVDEYTILTVMGTTGNDSGEYVTFSLYKTDLGPDAIYYFGYFDGSDLYADQNETFNTNVTVNSNSNKLKGTFSGTINGPANGEPLGVTNGSFDIQY